MDIGFEIFTAVIMTDLVLGDITPCSQWKTTDVSTERIAYILRFEELDKQEFDMKQTKSRAEDRGDIFFWNVGLLSRN
jgi:hypothetical protein